MRKVIVLLILVLVLPLGLVAQKLSKSDRILIQNLKGHIQLLASDELEGRRAGDIGEQKAIDYIIEQYRGSAVQPMGDNGFIQSFSIDEGKKLVSCRTTT